MNKTAAFISAGIVCLILSLDSPQPAEAGVLLRSSRVRSSVRFRPMQMRLPRAKKSTWAARRTLPKLGEDSRWGVETELKMVEQDLEYQEKVHKWQAKRTRELERKLRKEERKRARLERKLKREQEVLKRKQQKLAKIQVKKEQESGEVQRPESDDLIKAKTKDKSETSPVKDKTGKPKKPSFWARLKRAMFGG